MIGTTHWQRGRGAASESRKTRRSVTAVQRCHSFVAGGLIERMAGEQHCETVAVMVTHVSRRLSAVVYMHMFVSCHPSAPGLLRDASRFHEFIQEVVTAMRRDQRLWKEVEGPSGSLDRALRKLGAISMRAYAMTVHACIRLRGIADGWSESAPSAVDR